MTVRAEEEYTLVESLFLDNGIRQWSLRVPGIVRTSFLPKCIPLQLSLK